MSPKGGFPFSWTDSGLSLRVSQPTYLSFAGALFWFIALTAIAKRLPSRKKSRSRRNGKRLLRKRSGAIWEIRGKGRGPRPLPAFFVFIFYDCLRVSGEGQRPLYFVFVIFALYFEATWRQKTVEQANPEQEPRAVSGLEEPDLVDRTVRIFLTERWPRSTRGGAGMIFAAID